jgi:hypothetical protein
MPLEEYIFMIAIPLLTVTVYRLNSGKAQLETEAALST